MSSQVQVSIQWPRIFIDLALLTGSSYIEFFRVCFNWKLDCTTYFSRSLILKLECSWKSPRHPANMQAWLRRSALCSQRLSPDKLPSDADAIGPGTARTRPGRPEERQEPGVGGAVRGQRRLPRVAQEAQRFASGQLADITEMTVCLPPGLCRLHLLHRPRASEGSSLNVGDDASHLQRASSCGKRVSHCLCRGRGWGRVLEQLPVSGGSACGHFLLNTSFFFLSCMLVGQTILATILGWMIPTPHLLLCVYFCGKGRS